MAEAAEVAELRRLINEPTDAAPWTDAVLSARIDANEGTLVSLAATIWREKAASFAGLVDIKEGNSDRKMSQLYKQALEMASSLGGGDEALVVRRPTRTRKIERQ